MAQIEAGPTNHRIPSGLAEPVFNGVDRNILIIATTHGDVDNFPGKEQTLADLARFEHRYGRINAFSSDSLPDIEKAFKKYGPHTGDGYKNASVFTNWVVSFAKERGVPLIGADPTLVRRIDYVVEDELGADSDYLLKSYRKVLSGIEGVPDIDTNVKERRQAETAEDLAWTVTLGLLASTGFAALDSRVSRRTLIGSAASVVAAKAIHSGIRTVKPSSLENQAVLDQYHDDARRIKEVSDKPGDFPEGFDKSASFLRVAKFNSDTLPYSVLLRNSLIAEVLAAPKEELLGYKSVRPLNLADAMGFMHSVQKDHQISSLIGNIDLRRKTIVDLLTEVARGTEYIYGESGMEVVTPARFLEQVRTYPRRYEVDERGKISSAPIKVSALDDIVEDLTRNLRLNR